MFKRIQTLSKPQRQFVFFLLFGGGILILVAVTAFLISLALNQRETAISLDDTITVREFAALPDDDAYPPAVVVLADGSVVTGSYATGAMWRIMPEGTVMEIPGTRNGIGGDGIGAFTGAVELPNGSLIVIDQNDTDPRTEGGTLWRLSALDGVFGVMLTPFIVQGLDERGWISPNDAAVDAEGRLYISDSGRNEVWRFTDDGAQTLSGAVWWVPPVSPDDPRHAVNGLAYDPVQNALVITDPEVDVIYRVPVEGGDTEIVYDHADRDEYAPGFDGVTVTRDGTIYVAALAQKGIARVDDDALVYIAGLFRNPSDVAFAAPNRLYVPNFDQSSLVLPLDSPQLPFAIDVIELGK